MTIDFCSKITKSHDNQSNFESNFQFSCRGAGEWRSAGEPHNLAQLDVALNKFSACTRQLELSLDSLERSKLAESESAEQLWLEQLRILQDQIELQRDAHVALNRKCEQLLAALADQEQALQLAAKLDDVNFRWNTVRLRALGLHNYVQDGEEHARQLLLSVRELLEWVIKMRAQLLQQPPTAADLGTLGRQRNELRVFSNRLDEKRPLVESTLMAGRHYLAQQPLLAGSQGCV